MYYVESNFIENKLSMMEVITGLGLTTGLKVCLDAGDAVSYDGASQTWSSLASGGYDFYRGPTSGVDSADPTFNGISGRRSSAEYFSSDSGDYFKYDSTAEEWQDNLHQDGAKYTILTWCYLTGALTTHLMHCTGRPTVTTGFGFYQTSAGGLIANAGNGGTSVFSATSDNDPTQSAPTLIGVSIDEPTGAGGGFFYNDGSYLQVAAADTFDATYTAPSTGTASHVMHIGASGNGSFPLPSGTRVYATAIWEGVVLTKADMDNIYNAMKVRFGT